MMMRFAAVLGVALVGCRDRAPEPRGGAVEGGPTSAAPTSAPSASAVPQVASATPPEPESVVVDPAPTSAGAPAALYAELFTQGTTWKIHVNTRTSGLDDHGKQKMTASTSAGSCSVADVAKQPWGVVSHVTCTGFEEAGDADPIFGWWIATAVGLFHVTEPPDGTKAPPLTQDLFVMGATPAESKVEVKGNDPPNSGEKLEVQHKGNAWCHSASSWGGDEGWKSACIEPGRGFVSGAWGWAGGSTHENEFTAKLAKP